MSGLIKAKKYDWKDSNIANFGSDEDKQVKSEYNHSPYPQGLIGLVKGYQIWCHCGYSEPTWLNNMVGGGGGVKIIPS